MDKAETFEDLRQLTLDHTWVPARPWNLLKGPVSSLLPASEASSMWDRDQ